MTNHRWTPIALTAAAALCAATFTACDPYQHAAGIVLDRDSGRPLAGVLYYPLLSKEWDGAWWTQEKFRDQAKATDSSGHFDHSRIGHTDFTLIFQLDGYDTLHRPYTDVTDNDTVRLRRK